MSDDVGAVDTATSAVAKGLPPFSTLKEALLNPSRPIAQRMRAIFYLRSAGGDEALDTLCTALKDKRGSPLFRHELAYVLGQMQDVRSKPTLMEVLRDTTDEPIVRHEAAEALGALGDPDSIDILEEMKTDDSREVSETCEIALARLRWKQEQADNDEAAALDRNPFESVDPAPASGKNDLTVAQLRDDMMDTALPLFDRYRAMFSLRNRGTDESIVAIAEALKDDSALFRHEAAYVLGQLSNPVVFEQLRACVEDKAEIGMVRHEAAEALGAIGSEDAIKLLQAYLKDESSVVAESCIVALDIADYWSDVTAPESMEAGGSSAAGAGGDVAATAAITEP